MCGVRRDTGFLLCSLQQTCPGFQGGDRIPGVASADICPGAFTGLVKRRIFWTPWTICLLWPHPRVILITGHKW